MAGLSLSLVLVAVAVTWAVIAPSDDSEDQPYVVPVPAAPSATVDPAGAAEALQALVAALTTRDRSAAASLAAPDDPTTAARLEALVDVASAGRMTDLSLRYVDEDGGLGADGTWSAVVDATWAYSGFDDEATATEVSMRFRSSRDSVAIAGVGGGSSRTPVWMSGPMQVSRSGSLLVVAAAGTDLDAYVRLARSAIPTVTSVVTDWRPRLVVEVPVDGAALEAAVDAEPGYYAQIAAVTGGGGDPSPGAPVHILVNPDVYAGLGRAGREVVLAHEATHVATRAPVSRAPTWLTEGFADYVALRETQLPIERTAGQIAQDIKRFGLPRALPSTREFAADGRRLGATYEASWLACEVLGSRRGRQALVSFYSRVSAGTPLRPALEQELGWRLSQFVAAWRRRLADLDGTR